MKNLKNTNHPSKLGAAGEKKVRKRVLGTPDYMSPEMIEGKEEKSESKEFLGLNS